MNDQLKMPKLICLFKAEDFAAAMRLCKGVIEDAAQSSLVRWAVPSDGEMRQEEFERAIAQVEAKAQLTTPVVNAKLDFGKGIVATVYTRMRLGRERFTLRVRLELDSISIDEIISFQQLALSISRGLLKKGILFNVELIPDLGVSAAPDVPIAHVNTRLLVTTEAEVHESYDYPDVFWKADWDLIETVDDHRLLARGLDIARGRDYFAAIIPYQWAMARAAKPRLTRYFVPQVLPCEEDVYRAGEPRLGIVGHVSPENIVEFSCALEPNQHIQGWEIFDVWRLIQEGTLPDRRKVETVRVVCLDRWAAEQEKRPLLDIGARVYYHGDSGELVEITS